VLWHTLRKEKKKNIDEVLIYATKNVYKVDSTEVVAKLPLKNIENPQVYNSISKYVIKDQLSRVFMVLNNATGVSRLWKVRVEQEMDRILHHERFFCSTSFGKRNAKY
jgi:outer membrane receptor for ferric coprogen and ferric-rhodotorulic acid